MDSADDLTFRIIFSGDGAGKLRDKVKEKLKEFMGDYTDDTLVEYVIVLLKNGRRKEEAKNELNVFLGDDSDSFVSWLWDHLRLNLNLYAQPKESRPDEVAVKQKKEDHSDSEVIKSNKASKKRVSKDWRGVVMRDPDEPPPLRSAVIANIHDDDNTLQSLQPVVQRKRGRSGERGQIDDRGPPDERSQVKREAVSKPSLGASRRLLQFAVRDAVATSRSTGGLTSEPSFKRLRSVVSTPPTDENDSSPQFEQQRRPKIRSVAARVPKAMAVAIKAVADAAKDVVKVKPPSGNVFDRLGRSTADLSDQFIEYRDEDTQITEATVPTYYDHEGYENMDGRGKMGIISQIGNDSVMLDYNNVVDGTIAANNNKPQRDDNNNNKMVNVSLNVNSGKPSSHYQKPRAVLEMENQNTIVQETQLDDARNSVAVSNGNGAPIIHAQREIQKALPSTGVNSTGRPIEDVDSRTIFVSNVHFGATKDSLSRHFNKFGDVLKVVIVTEAATGQPKGSAYVEFMRKEAAENALSLDGTSFMSRILKVVRKSSAQEASATATTTTTTTPVASWPRAASRGSPFAAASRFGRLPFPTPYRPRLPLKPGGRSFQWKRESSENIPSPTAIPSPTTAARSLTYVRPEASAKTAGNSHNV